MLVPDPEQRYPTLDKQPEGSTIEKKEVTQRVITRFYSLLQRFTSHNAKRST